MLLDQTVLLSKVLSMLVIEDRDEDVEGTEAEEAEDVDTENLNGKEIERSALETRDSVSAGDLLNRDARGDAPTAGTTPVVKNQEETVGTIPERSTIVTLDQEEEITTQYGLTTTQEQLPAQARRHAVEVGAVDPAVEAVVEAAQDAAGVAVDEVLLITETVITTSTMTTVLDREVAAVMTTTGETPTMTETTVETGVTEERPTRIRAVEEANRATATAAVPVNRSNSVNSSLATALKRLALRAVLAERTVCMVF